MLFTPNSKKASPPAAEVPFSSEQTANSDEDSDTAAQETLSRINAMLNRKRETDNPVGQILAILVANMAANRRQGEIL